jgi:Holliday junction resolvase
MAKGKNEKRPHASQTNHDKMIRYIANSLKNSGYTVKADHIGCHDGSPEVINDYIPDITASKGGQYFILEVETCPTYNDTHTKEQLADFSKMGTTYMMVPHSCQRDGKPYDHISEIKLTLKQWELSSVKIGTCNPFDGTIKYDV